MCPRLAIPTPCLQPPHSCTGRGAFVQPPERNEACKWCVGKPTVRHVSLVKGLDGLDHTASTARPRRNVATSSLPMFP